MRNRVERVAVGPHEVLQFRVRERLDAVVDGEHGPDVRVDHEAGERAQHLEGVVARAGAAALGVRDGDEAVQARVHAGQGLQPRGELARETGGARRRAEDDDRVARADAAVARPAITGERARGLGPRYGRGGADDLLLERERLE